MLCEKCKKRTATVFYNENINGRTRAYSLCAECAAKLREKGDIQEVTSMIGSFADPFSALQSDIFGGFFGLPTVKSTVEKKCEVCSSTYADISRCGKVGCPACYDTFSDELSRTIQSIHGTTTHTGNIPSRYRAQQARIEKLKKLKNQLQEAIRKEDFERAAALRDEVRALETEGTKEDKS